jgi:hypothetical protein
MVVSILSQKRGGTPIHHVQDMPKLPSEQKEMIRGGVDDSMLFDGPVVPHPHFRILRSSKTNTLVVEGVTEAVFMLYHTFLEQLQGPSVVICSQPINAPEDVPHQLSESSWYRLVYQVQDQEEYVWVRNLVAQIPPYVPLAAMELYLKTVAVNDYTPQSNEKYVHPEVFLQ